MYCRLNQTFITFLIIAARTSRLIDGITFLGNFVLDLGTLVVFRKRPQSLLKMRIIIFLGIFYSLQRLSVKQSVNLTIERVFYECM